MSEITFTINEKEYGIPEIVSIENYIKLYRVKDILSDEYALAKVINIFTGAPVDELLLANHKEVKYIGNRIMAMLPQDNNIPFKDTFKLKGIEYGFLPKWEKLSFAEYADIDTINKKKPEEVLDYLNVLAAIYYRPITKKISDHEFEIEEYDSDEALKRAEIFRENLDIQYVLGAQFFFIKFAKRSFSHSQSFSMTNWEMMKFLWRNRRKIHQWISRIDSDGTPSLIDWQMMILQDTMKSSKKGLSKFSINYLTSLKKTKRLKSSKKH